MLGVGKDKDVKCLGERRMRDPNHSREQARRCRSLAKTAVERELIEQFMVWSIELAEEADDVERAVETEENPRCG